MNVKTKPLPTATSCTAELGALTCDLTPGHDGPHAAHAPDAVWTDDDGSLDPDSYRVAGSALLDALADGDARAVAAAILRSKRTSYRSGAACLVEAVDTAADLAARSIPLDGDWWQRHRDDFYTARTYAAAWRLLSDREQRAYARRQRDRAALEEV